MRAYIAILLLLTVATTIEAEVGENWTADGRVYQLLDTSVNGTHIQLDDGTSRIFEIEECHDLNDQEYFCIDRADNITATITIEGYDREVDLEIEIESSMQIGEQYQVQVSFENPLPTPASVTLTYNTEANVASEGQFNEGEWQGVVEGGATERATITIEPINTDRIDIEFELTGDLNGSENAKASVSDRLSTSIDTPSTFSVGIMEEVEITLTSEEELETAIVITPTQSVSIRDANIVDEQDDGTWREDFDLNETKTITLEVVLEKAVNASVFIDIYTEFEGWSAERRFIEPIIYSGFEPLQILSENLEVVDGQATLQIRNPNSQALDVEVVFFGGGVNISERRNMQAGQIFNYDIDVGNAEKVFSRLSFEDSRSRPLWTNNTITLREVETVEIVDEESSPEYEVNQTINETQQPLANQSEEVEEASSSNQSNNQTIIPPPQKQESSFWLPIMIAIIFVGGLIAIAKLKASRKKMSEQERQRYLDMIQNYSPTSAQDAQLKQEILSDLRANK